MSDRRRPTDRETGYDPRRRTDRDPVYEDDDWQKGFSRYREYVQRERRKRDSEPDMNWDSYTRNAKAHASRKRQDEGKEDIPDYDYAEIMARYKHDFKLFPEDKLKVPPPKPPWFNSDTGKRAGSGDYRAVDSDEELSISNRSLGSNSEDLDDIGPPPSVPSWARSEKKYKGSTSSKASGKESKVKPPSVKSHSNGGEVKKEKPVIVANSETQFKAALIELLAR